jgi:hypothetical protein
MHTIQDIKDEIKILKSIKNTTREQRRELRLLEAELKRLLDSRLPLSEIKRKTMRETGKKYIPTEYDLQPGGKRRRTKRRTRRHK